jgi:hypothetical protein
MLHIASAFTSTPRRYGISCILLFLARSERNPSGSSQVSQLLLCVPLHYLLYNERPVNLARAQKHASKLPCWSILKFIWERCALGPVVYNTCTHKSWTQTLRLLPYQTKSANNKTISLCPLFWFHKHLLCWLYPNWKALGLLLIIPKYLITHRLHACRCGKMRRWMS